MHDRLPRHFAMALLIVQILGWLVQKAKQKAVSSISCLAHQVKTLKPYILFHINVAVSRITKINQWFWYKN